MTKTDLIEQVAAQTQMTKKDTGNVVDAVFERITQSLASGEKVQIIGFGTFEVRDRSERMGRNPQTGEEMKIPAKRVPAFKAGKQLKDSVDN